MEICNSSQVILRAYIQQRYSPWLKRMPSPTGVKSTALNFQSEHTTIKLWKGKTQGEQKEGLTKNNPDK